MKISMIEEIDTIKPDVKAIETALAEAVAAPAKDEGTKPADQQQKPVDDRLPADDSVPAKLRGKTAAELAQLYQNLESSYGRMANDLGQQRKLTDRLLDLKRAEDLKQNSPEPPKVDRSRLLEDPTAELDRFITARESTRESEATQRLQQIESSLAAREFVSKHPDYEEIGADPGFAEWINRSAFRQRAAATAYNGDWQAADELMSEYKAVRPAKTTDTTTTAADAAKAGVEAARAASLESGTGAGGNSGSAKTYRRVDLMELRLTKPDTYYDPAMQAEIMKAYAEGRVK